MKKYNTYTVSKVFYANVDVKAESEYDAILKAQEIYDADSDTDDIDWHSTPWEVIDVEEDE